jgi:hypothetical protein
MNMNSNTKTETQVRNKKSLPAKHNQLVVFSYWMLNQMKSDGKLSDEAFVECLEKFHVFHDVEIQKEYFDHYFEDFKLIQKSLKQEVREKNKKPKAKKAKAVDPNEPPKKRGRKRKVIHDNRSPEEILLDEIIRNCNEPQLDPEPQPQPKKRGRRRKIKTVVSMVPDDHIIGQLIAECKRNGIEELESFDYETNEEESEEEEQEEQEIEVRKIIIHDVTYLIDENDTIYDMDTHEELGVYDKNALQIVRDS